VMLRFGGPPERAVCSAARWPRRQLRNPTWSWRRIKRLKALERENATLKRLLADADLEKVALTKIANGISGRHSTRRACHDPDATLPSARRRFGPAYHTRAEDRAVNHEKMQRLWREQGLRAPRRRRRSGHHSDRRTRNALVRRGPVHGFRPRHWAPPHGSVPVIPLGVAGAPPRAGIRISRRTHCRGVQHRLRGRRCPPSE